DPAPVDLEEPAVRVLAPHPAEQRAAADRLALVPRLPVAENGARPPGVPADPLPRDGPAVLAQVDDLLRSERAAADRLVAPLADQVPGGAPEGIARPGVSLSR